MILKVDNLPTYINLGRQSENSVKEICIDCATWLNKWPDLMLNIVAVSPNGGQPYIAQTTMDGTILVWTVTESDTAVPGIGKMEVVGVSNGKRKLSSVARTSVSSRLWDIETGTPPRPGTGIVDKVLDAAASAQESAERAEAAVERIEVIVENLATNLEIDSIHGGSAAGTEKPIE